MKIFKDSKTCMREYVLNEIRKNGACAIGGYTIRDLFKGQSRKKVIEYLGMWNELLLFLERKMKEEAMKK